AILNGDFEMSEWGYFSFAELTSIRVSGVFEVDRDLYWDTRKASLVSKICKGNGWPTSEEQIERLLELDGITADRCKVCGSVIDTSLDEKNLFCKKCGTSTVKEIYYIGKNKQMQKPTA
ncbi:hypothetical protein N9C84_04145, partial [Desulfobacterales bacterium]|nr:hypothetical protein [Desulfobacterales bacterium]